jgi:autotransporter-associated beta strand protein
MDNSGAGADGTVTFAGVVGTNEDVAAIGITGNLDLNAAIGSGATAGATSISVSGESNLGANVKTTGDQTYTGAATLSANNTLTTTSNGTVSFVSTTDSDVTDRTLAITTNGTGDVSFTGAVGGTGGLNGLTIDTNQFNAAALTVGGTISITNTDTASSEITGVIANDGDAAVFTKAGTGTLTLSATNTYTGATTVNNGTLKVTADDALGTTAAGTIVASGATLDFENVAYATAEAVTVNGGTISTSSGTSSFAGAITLGAHSIFDVDGTQLTVSGNVTDGVETYNITKTGNGILVLSNTTNSYDGTTTISAGTLTVTGRLDSGSYSANIINNSALIYNSTSAQEFSGVISGTGTLEKDNADSTLTLSGTNTYSGDTTISAGIIAISDADALGNDSGTRGTTTVDSGAALYISGGITVAEPINISGTGISSGGAIRFTANNNMYSGAITLGATSSIVSNSGQQEISGTINGSNDNTEALTITANDNLTISGEIGGIANKQPSTLDITTTGSGVLTLSNDITTDNDQTYTAAGGVLLGANISLTATSSDILFSGTASTLDSSDATARDLTVDQIEFDGEVGGMNWYHRCTYLRCRNY